MTLDSRILRGLRALLPLALLLLASCAENGHFTILGYTTQPNYDPSIHTVAVTVFHNETIRDSSRHNLELELTRAVIREIEQNTPYKVVGIDQNPDTELTGVITQFNKIILNRNQLNEVREGDMNLFVNAVWRDLRTGEVLSQMRRKLDALPPPIDTPLPPDPNKFPPPLTTLQSEGNFIPELGESMATGRKKATDRMAQHIREMMEKPW